MALTLLLWVAPRNPWRPQMGEPMTGGGNLSCPPPGVLQNSHLQCLPGFRNAIAPPLCLDRTTFRMGCIPRAPCIADCGLGLHGQPHSHFFLSPGLPFFLASLLGFLYVCFLGPLSVSVSQGLQHRSKGYLRVDLMWNKGENKHGLFAWSNSAHLGRQGVNENPGKELGNPVVGWHFSEI